MQQPTLFDELPANFYKTINLPADELRAARESNNLQNTRVLAIFEKHPAGLTPFEASRIYNGKHPEIPLTSVRRAVTDLEKSGRLEKTGVMRAGGYGKPNHVWKVKAAK